MAAKYFPPVQYLHECFSYDPETGRFFWRRRPEHHFETEAAHTTWNKRWAGKEAFTQKASNGYLLGRVAFGGKYFRMLAHRVAFAMMTGVHPKDQIDHIDRERANNRWVNIREATHAENNWNRQERESPYPRGVQKNGKNGYSASIWNNRKYRYLGTFRTVEEAHAARLAAEKETRSHFLEAAS